MSTLNSTKIALQKEKDYYRALISVLCWLPILKNPIQIEYLIAYYEERRPENGITIETLRKILEAKPKPAQLVYFLLRADLYANPEEIVSRNKGEPRRRAAHASITWLNDYIKVPKIWREI